MSRPYESTHRVCVTNAPQAYDYDYAVALADYPIGDEFTDKGFRAVAIPLEAFSYQTDRYRSGMYAVVEA